MYDYKIGLRQRFPALNACARVRARCAYRADLVLMINRDLDLILLFYYFTILPILILITVWGLASLSQPPMTFSFTHSLFISLVECRCHVVHVARPGAYWVISIFVPNFVSVNIKSVAYKKNTNCYK